MNAINENKQIRFCDVKRIILDIVKSEREYTDIYEYNSLYAAAKNQINTDIENKIQTLNKFYFVECKTGKHNTIGTETAYSYLKYHGLNLLKWYESNNPTSQKI